MIVDPSAPRSTVTFAPISTSSCTTTLPTCALSGARAVKRIPESVRAEHRAAVNSDPLTHPACEIERHSGEQVAVRPNPAPVADLVAPSNTARARSRPRRRSRSTAR